jgi:FkbM family methyltransferase
VGANRGEISKSFCESLSVRSAWAFEANPLVFREFTSVGVPENMKVYNLGMGSGTQQNMLLKVPVHNRSRNSGNGSFLEQVDQNEYQVFEVRMSSVDTVVEENGLKNIFGLWIDVEGFTYEVLMGSSRALESHQVSFIFLEMETRVLWKSGADAKSIDSFLRNFGYRRIARDFEYPGQFNCIYTNQEQNIQLASMYLVYSVCEIFILLASLLLLPAEVVVKILKRILQIVRKSNVK